jgi:hypothetical protein
MEALLLPLNVHDSPDVTSLQTCTGQILHEYHAIVFLDHDSAGQAAMSGGASCPLSAGFGDRSYL